MMHFASDALATGQKITPRAWPRAGWRIFSTGRKIHLIGFDAHGSKAKWNLTVPLYSVQGSRVVPGGRLGGVLLSGG
jgi:hypothetical protein